MAGWDNSSSPPRKKGQGRYRICGYNVSFSVIRQPEDKEHIVWPFFNSISITISEDQVSNAFVSSSFDRSIRIRAVSPNLSYNQCMQSAQQMHQQLEINAS